MSWGGPFNISYIKKNLFQNLKPPITTKTTTSSSTTNIQPPIRYVYYTECDQIVRFDNDETFKALSVASNSSTFFVGRRKEKNRDTEPEVL